ncbi:MAG: hypothetical protein RTU63_08285 [Candidatus Thorarchaeota archaeon]
MTKQEDFLTLVEDGVQRVYPEKSAEEVNRIYVPMILGGIIAIVSEGVSFILTGSLAIEIVLLFMIVPLLIGTILTGVVGVSMVRNEGRYGVRGINRKILSRAIHFLDMVHQGHADIGEVTDSPRPDELAITATIGFGSAVYAIKRIDPVLAKTWISTLSEKLRPESSSKSIWFIRITIFGILAAFPIIFIAMILNEIGIVNEDFFKYIVIIAVVVLLSFLSALFVFVITKFDDEAPQGVLDALSEPQLRMDTEMVLDRIIQTVREEGQYPLRVLVLSKYDDLVYTERSYKTSKDYDLMVAVLFPVNNQPL